jgi:hypothetical protein
MVSIQFSYTSSSKCRCSSPFGNFMPCSFLTSRFYSLNYFSYGDVIYGTFTICLATHTIIGIIDGSILPLIIFCALTYVFSCSLSTLELEVFPFSTLFFLLKESVATFFLFSSVVWISFLVLLSLVGGFYGFSFWCTNRYQKIFSNTNANWQVYLLSPLLSLTYFDHRSNSLHRLLNIFYAQFTFCPFSTTTRKCVLVHYGFH